MLRSYPWPTVFAFVISGYLSYRKKKIVNRAEEHTNPPYSEELNRKRIIIKIIRALEDSSQPHENYYLILSIHLTEIPLTSLLPCSLVFLET